MKLFETIYKIMARRAMEREMLVEFANLSDAEMQDLDLSYAKITDMARRQAISLAV